LLATNQQRSPSSLFYTFAALPTCSSHPLTIVSHPLDRFTSGRSSSGAGLPRQTPQETDPVRHREIEYARGARQCLRPKTRRRPAPAARYGEREGLQPPSFFSCFLFFSAKGSEEAANVAARLHITLEEWQLRPRLGGHGSNWRWEGNTGGGEEVRKHSASAIAAPSAGAGKQGVPAHKARRRGFWRRAVSFFFFC